MLRVLSLGAGVQSTTIALMMARGDLLAPDCAIFADTGWEPDATYKHLAWLETQLPFPVRRVRAGNLRDDIETGISRRTGRIAAVPWHLKNPDGSAGMGRRQCTSHYKLEPITKELRILLGVGPRSPIKRGSVEMLIGISIDEAARMKPAKQRFITSRWPLIDLLMSRRDCLRWLADRQYTEPPKSACIGCPFHHDATWLKMKRESPAEFAQAVDLDAKIRNGGSSRGIRGQQFMHRSLKPLGEVEFKGEGPDLFNMECEGMCGV